MAGDFSASKANTRGYQASLRAVAKETAKIMRARIKPDGSANLDLMQDRLKSYSNLLDPWARKIINKMIERTLNKSKAAFSANSKQVSKGIANQLKDPVISKVVRDLQRENLKLIKSIPVQAGERVQEIAAKQQLTGERASLLAKHIRETEGVTESRANLIARTETSKANSSIVEAQAKSVGAEKYIWRTAGDGDVRESHAAMEGTVHRFDKPPLLPDGTTGNPGTFPHCRCYAEVIFD